jgi:hypothetical protein
MTWGGVILLTFALFSPGFFGVFIVGGSCENVRPGTARGDVCTAVGEAGGAQWWLLACAPASVFGAVAVLGGRRGPLGYLWAAACAALVAVDAILIAIVTDNL